MARFPSLSQPAQALRESVFARLAARLAGQAGEVFPFYLGDTCLPPPPAAVAAARAALDDPEHLRYGPPAGDPALLDALVEKCRRANRLPWVDRAALVVTAGATAALAAAARALLDPGDELLVATPHWPLIRGIASNAGAIPVEVPLAQALYTDPGYDVAAAFAAARTERTRAVYFATPNNPDGKVLPLATLEAIARFARANDLWVIADEVYEDLIFDRARTPHVSIASLDGMAERTLTAFSLSKSYALAGLRLGYLVGDPRVLHAARKIANHTVYNVPVALQRGALAALEHGGGWLDEARATYRAARDAASRALATIPHHLPDGGAYLFLDLDGRIGEGVERFHERIIDGGVAISPGEQFGAAFSRHARLCYTALPAERMERGLSRLVALLE